MRFVTECKTQFECGFECDSSSRSAPLEHECGFECDPRYEDLRELHAANFPRVVRPGILRELE